MFDALMDKLDEQEERIKELEQINEEHRKINGELRKENQILRENAEHNDKVVDKARWEKMIYKARIDKAIEYLEKERDKWRRKYYKEVDNTNRLSSTINFCIENMKNEFDCTDQRTKQELHEMVETLEELLIEKPKQPERSETE